MKKNLPVTDNEVTFETPLISTTNLKGIITGFNAEFIKISGFDATELMNANHNIIRHPDMPPAAFEDLWNTVKNGKHWMGIVKNRTKNGDYYWVDAYVTPIFENDQVVGYESVRTKPSPERVARASEVYARLNAGKSATRHRFFNLSLKTKSLVSNIIASFVALLVYVALNEYGLGIITPLVLALILGSMTYYVSRTWTFSTITKAHKEAKKQVDNALMAQIYTGDSDEVSQVKLASDLLNAKLRTVLVRLADTAEKIGAEAIKTFQSQKNIQSSVNSQASQSEQVATAMTEMSASIQEVARNAAEAATHASSVDQLSRSSSVKASSALSSLASLDKSFEKIVEVVSGLEKNANEITPIIDVISKITEQTNLLALNAAIEAARAGTAGRGFAVVADEVRQLATRTQQSTQEVSLYIHELNSAVSNAINEVKQSQSSASESRSEVEQSINSVGDIAEKIDKLNELNTLIATAVEEQSSVSEDINRNVTQISSDAEDVVSNIKQVNSNTEALADQSATLTNMIKRFSVS